MSNIGKIPFTLWRGKSMNDLGEYLRQYLKNNPTHKVYIGTDSDQQGKNTAYITAICLYNDDIRAGVHIVRIDQKVPRITDNFVRLWKEAEISKDIADLLEKELDGVLPRNGHDKLCEVHLDYNAQAGRRVRKAYQENKSYKVYKATIDWLKGEGYRVKIKPDAFAATCAADYALNKSTR